MTNSNDRLDRIERAIEGITISLAETKNIANSNARTIQSMLEQQASERLNEEERRIEHEARIERLENNLIELTGISRALAN